MTFWIIVAYKLKPADHSLALLMIDLKMKQWVTTQDGLDQLKLVEVPAPERLGDDEVFVKINAVSLNYRDTEGELKRLYLNTIP